MSESVANAIIWIGIGAGIVVWLFGLRSLRRIANSPDELFHETTVPFGLEVTQQAILHAASNHKSKLSPEGVQVLNQEPDFVTFDLSAGTQVTCELEEVLDGTKIFATADYAHVRQRYRFVMSLLVVFLIPVVIATVGFGLLKFVTPSPKLPVRWQSLQILQISHSLWPPFLVSKLFHANIDHANNFLRNLLVSAKLADRNPSQSQ